MKAEGAGRKAEFWRGSYFLCFVILCVGLIFPRLITAQSAGGGQTKANESGWTVDTLKAHVDDINALRWKRDEDIAKLRQELADSNLAYLKELARERDLRYEQRFNAQEAASTYTRTIQNEFRGSLNDLASTKVPRTEFEAALKAVSGQIANDQKANGEKLDILTKSSAIALSDIQHRLDIKEGSSAGIGSAFGTTATAIGAIVAVLGVIYLLSSRRNSKPPWMDELVSQIKTSIQAK